MLKHIDNGYIHGNPNRWKLLQNGNDRMAYDGYSNLKYRVIDRHLHKLYTWVLVGLMPI